MGEWIEYSYDHIGDMKDTLLYVDVDITEYDARFWTWNQDEIRMEIQALEDDVKVHRIYVDGTAVAHVLFDGSGHIDTVLFFEDVPGMLYDTLNRQYIDFCELWDIVYIKGGV